MQKFSLINKDEYQAVFQQSREKITAILHALKPYRTFSSNEKIAFLVNQLADVPYLYKNAMGEGDWQPGSPIYQSGAVHINQNSVYRLDGFNCQTFVQTVMALMLSNNLQEFDRYYLKIAYGAAVNSQHEIVRYYNRNHFIEADFNPVNQRNLLISDIISDSLRPYTKKLNIRITRKKWFLNQQKNLADTIHVFSEENGRKMINRFYNVYPRLSFPHFNSEWISLRYIPKEWLAIRQRDGTFQPNKNLFDKIPVPSIAEIVRIPFKDNGSELSISHLGFLYKKIFHRGELIYHKITCEMGRNHQKICAVTPVVCKEKSCNTLMFSHATQTYPDTFFWYHDNNGKFFCSSKRPEKNIPFTFCNRVMALPFYEYLTEKQFGSYWNMDQRSILGVHIEKLNVS